MMSDVGSILKLVLDQPDLQQYLHSELPERVPIRVLRKDTIFDGIVITKFGGQIEFVDPDQIDQDREAYLEFETFDVSENTSFVQLHYEIEGVFGTFRLVNDGEVWSVETAEIVER